VLPQLAQSQSVLVKGSRFMKMERVVEAILQKERQEGSGNAS
jgi:UDP-N-acetylmuramyl pentapeptide synthase